MYSISLTSDERCVAVCSTKLRRLLDVAATHEPDWSEEGAGVGEPGHSSARQLDGIASIRVALVPATLLGLLTTV